MDKKNVLYISYDGMTDTLGQSQVLSYLIPLSKKGVIIHIISFEKPELYLSKKEIVIDKTKRYRNYLASFIIYKKATCSFYT